MSNANDYDDDLDSIVESVRSAAIDGLLRAIHLDRQRKCSDFEAYLTRFAVVLFAKSISSCDSSTASRCK